MPYVRKVNKTKPKSCQFIAGDMHQGAVECGAPVQSGKLYCDEHWPSKFRQRFNKEKKGFRLVEDLGRGRTCQFIAGDTRRGATECGAPVKKLSSYCPEHHAVCFLSKANEERSEAGKKAWETRVELYGPRGTTKPKRAPWPGPPGDLRGRRT